MPQEWITSTILYHTKWFKPETEMNFNQIECSARFMAERFRRALFNQPNFQDLPSNVQNTLWKQNQSSALTLFFVKMETERKTSGQLFNIFHGGLGSRQNWATNFL